MRVPINNLRPPQRPKQPTPEFDPYIALAIVMLGQQETIPALPAAPQPSRSTIEAQPSEPPPGEPAAEVVDLDEVRRERQRPEIDRHAELLGPLGEINDGVTRLRKDFAAANDGSLA